MSVRFPPAGPCQLLLCAALWSCGQKAALPAPTSPPAAATPVPVPTQQGRSDPACAAPIEAAASRLMLRAQKGVLKLGVLAGLKDAEDENLQQIQALAEALQAKGAEVLLAAGDLGDTVEAQVALLGALGARGLPVLALPGNREVRADLDGALDELKREGRTVVDLSRVRALDLGDLLVVSLPGTSERRLLRSDGACVYVQADVDALAAFLDKRPPAGPPVLLVAAVPPRGGGAGALDVSEGQNLGDPRLNSLLTPTRAAFGVFGQVWEAGGRAVDGTGASVGKGAAAQLYVNPGAADRTPWPMADGTTAKGLAGLLTIAGRGASYEVVRPAEAPEGNRP